MALARLSAAARRLGDSASDGLFDERSRLQIRRFYGESSGFDLRHFVFDCGRRDLLAKLVRDGQRLEKRGG